jgi:hypothetical protein
MELEFINLLKWNTKDNLSVGKFTVRENVFGMMELHILEAI